MYINPFFFFSSIPAIHAAAVVEVVVTGVGSFGTVVAVAIPVVA